MWPWDPAASWVVPKPALGEKGLPAQGHDEHSQLLAPVEIISILLFYYETLLDTAFPIKVCLRHHPVHSGYFRLQNYFMSFGVSGSFN